jgi:hypothetical protein
MAVLMFVQVDGEKLADGGVVVRRDCLLVQRETGGEGASRSS